MKKSKKILIPLFYKKKPRRPLSKKQKGLLKFTLQKFLFKKEKVQNSKKRFLEIGFGYGENIIHLSKKNGDKLIIGCEIYEPGIANLVSKIESENLKNIYIFPENIFSLLSELKKNSIEKIFILYPDPWPKKKHYKRRLISSVFLNKINSVLKTNGIVFVSTDSEDYLKVILNNFYWIKIFCGLIKKSQIVMKDLKT